MTSVQICSAAEVTTQTDTTSETGVQSADAATAPATISTNEISGWPTGPEITSETGVLMDADSGRVLFGKDADVVRPMASTTKIMTCILALEYLREHPDQTIEVSDQAAYQPKVHLGMQKGEVFYIKDLLYSLMLESHNDSAVAVAEGIAGSVEEFAKEMFKAGTSLKGKTVEQIFNSDFKPFTIEDTKVGIAQVNTMDIEGFMPLKEEMLNYMDQKAKEAGLDMVMLLLTDILNEGSEILVTGNKPEIVEKAFNVTLKDKGAFLPGVLSRKKQVVPPITNAITA